jgi:hypothetical protein
MEKAIVYLINNDKKYYTMALNSISMLRNFNKNIKVICLTTEKKIPENLNVENVLVKNIDNEYFLTNKTQLSKLEYKSILYIDADTFIFDDIEKIFNYYQEDFCGCENKWSYNLNFNQFKPINGGVLLFNNYSHKKIYEDFIVKIKNLEKLYPDMYRWLKEIKNMWVREEFLTSKIAYEEKLSISFFERQHVKIIEEHKDLDNIKDTIIFHSFTNNWSLIKNHLNKNNIKLFKMYKKIKSNSFE